MGAPIVKPDKGPLKCVTVNIIYLYKKSSEYSKGG